MITKVLLLLLLLDWEGFSTKENGRLTRSRDIPIELKKEILLNIDGNYDLRYDLAVEEEIEKLCDNNENIIRAVHIWVGMLAEWGAMEKTEYIEDMDLRIAVLDFYFDYRHYVAWVGVINKRLMKEEEVEALKR